MKNYPGLNDFGDALEAIPLEMVRHLTLLKEIDAKCTAVSPQLSSEIAKFMVSESSGEAREAELAQIITLLKELMPCIEEKMHVASMAADTMARHTQRIAADFDLIAEHEIPKHVQVDLNDPALSVRGPEPIQTGVTTRTGATRAGANTRRSTVETRQRATTTTTAGTTRGRGRRGTPQAEEKEEEIPGEVLYCYCSNRGEGQMIACDGPDCRREWFHLSCLGMAQAPKGQWLCRDCKR